MSDVTIRPEYDPDGTLDEPIHIDSPVCRGCGGLGVDIKVTPRALQMINNGVRFPAWEDVDPVRGRINRRERYVRLAVHTLRSQGVFHGPYEMCRREIADLIERGFTPDEFYVPWPDDGACEWCGGFGVKGLSIATLEAELQRRGQAERPDPRTYEQKRLEGR